MKRRGGAGTMAPPVDDQQRGLFQFPRPAILNQSNITRFQRGLNGALATKPSKWP